MDTLDFGMLIRPLSLLLVKLFKIKDHLRIPYPIILPVKFAAVMMGDEPTGNLDRKNREIVFDIFKELAKLYNQSLLIVTHDNEFANRSDRIIEIDDGKIVKM